MTTSARNFRHDDRDRSAAVRRAYDDLDAFAAGFEGWLRVEQVHGARVLAAPPDASSGATLGRADGIVRDEATPGPRLLTATVADCVPVYLAWPGGYGLLHAGWRGSAAGVLEAGLAATGADPLEVRAHLGPAIGACCYEVGPEVVEAVLPGGAARSRARRAGGDRWRLDLRGALTDRARFAGVRGDRITVSPACTACGEGFHSFRASGTDRVRRLMLGFLGRPAP